jgi:hypothetical protein
MVCNRREGAGDRPEDKDMQIRPWSDPENFNAGYVMRSQHILFKQGDREPWTHMIEHEQEREILPEADLEGPSATPRKALRPGCARLAATLRCLRETHRLAEPGERAGQDGETR